MRLNDLCWHGILNNLDASAQGPALLQGLVLYGAGLGIEPRTRGFSSQRLFIAILSLPWTLDLRCRSPNDPTRGFQQ